MKSVNADNHHSVFVMTVNNSHELEQTRLLIQSLRTFGGHLRHCPVWVFVSGEAATSAYDLETLKTKVHPLIIPDQVQRYWFARKVCACAQAEAAVTPEITSLVWSSCDCLIIQPPELLPVNAQYDAAFRPVHQSNIGLPISKPLDYFWQTIFRMVNLDESHLAVESYVDQQYLRAYFNSHIFSWNPLTGMGQRWLELFTTLVCDRNFQSKGCQDILHQIFLHQAVLSALAESMFTPERIRLLPPDYSYPYNLQSDIPPDRRALALNDLNCIAYEDRPLHPTAVHDILIKEPLHGWLTSHLHAPQS